MHFRLSLLMFLNFAVLGAWVPVLAPFLKQLAFTPGQTAWIFATNALGAMLGPVLWGQIADRWLAAEKCICFCCLVSGACLWLVASSVRADAVFWGCLGYWTFMIPALSVGASLTFRHLRNPEKEYGPVRLWGTIGWIAIGWALTGWYLTAYGTVGADVHRADALYLGAICAWVTAVYAWTLPHTPPLPRIALADARTPRRWLTTLLDAPLKSLHLFRNRSFSVLCSCLFVVYMTFTLSSQLTALLLKQQGVAEAWLPLVQTIAQSTEVAALAALPILLVRLGQKGAMVLGLTSWALALTIFSSGAPQLVVIASLALHGVFITCFIVSGQLYINRLARADIRASAQGMMQLINGAGLFLGHMMVGSLRNWADENFALCFLPGAIVAGLLVVAFGIGFQTSRH